MDFWSKHVNFSNLIYLKSPHDLLGTSIPNARDSWWNSCRYGLVHGGFILQVVLNSLFMLKLWVEGQSANLSGPSQDVATESNPSKTFADLNCSKHFYCFYHGTAMLPGGCCQRCSFHTTHASAIGKSPGRHLQATQQLPGIISISKSEQSMAWEKWYLTQNKITTYFHRMIQNYLKSVLTIEKRHNHDSF